MKRNDIGVITTFSDSNYKEYAYRFVSGCNKLGLDVVCYVDCDKDNYLESNHIRYVKTPLQKINKFINRHTDHKPRNFLEDACRFSYKVYAMCDAVRKINKKYIIFLDADTYADESIPINFWEEIAPRSDEVVSFLGRKNSYPETGFLMFNLMCNDTQRFINDFENCYNEDTIMQLNGQTDCHAFQYALKNYKGRNLTPNANMFDHCFLDVFGKYMDHTKGIRKLKGYSKERKK